MAKTYGPQQLSVPSRFLGGLKAEIHINARDAHTTLVRIAAVCLFLDEKGELELRRRGHSSKDEISTYIDKIIRDRTNDGQQPFRIPDNYKGGDLIVAEVEKRESEIVGQYLDWSWLGLSEDQRQEIRDRFNARVLKAINGGGGFDVRTKEIILQHVARVADEVIARRAEEIRTQVEKEVDRRWSEVVESIVSKKLADAIAKIKAEMTR